MTNLVLVAALAGSMGLVGLVGLVGACAPVASQRASTVPVAQTPTATWGFSAVSLAQAPAPSTYGFAPALAVQSSEPASELWGLATVPAAQRSELWGFATTPSTEAAPSQPFTARR